MRSRAVIRVGTARSMDPRPDGDVVRAFAPAGPGQRSVIRWALRHAAHLGATVDVLVGPEPHDPEPAGPTGLLVQAGRDLVEALVGPWWGSVGHTEVRELAGSAAGSLVLVVPRGLHHLADLVAQVHRPLVVVPEDPDDPDPGVDAPIVLGLAPWTRSEVVGLAVDAAVHEGVALRVVRAGSTDPEVVVACQDDLAAWRIARPELPVEVEVLEGDTTDRLAELSREARLVVVGRSARSRRRELVSPSPVSGLLTRSACPVMVVPD